MVNLLVKNFRYNFLNYKFKNLYRKDLINNIFLRLIWILRICYHLNLSGLNRFLWLSLSWTSGKAQYLGCRVIQLTWKILCLLKIILPILCSSFQCVIEDMLNKYITDIYLASVGIIKLMSLYGEIIIIAINIL